MKLITVQKFLLCFELELGGIIIGYWSLFWFILQFLAALIYTEYSMNLKTVLTIIIIFAIYGVAFYSCVLLIKGSKMVRIYVFIKKLSI